LKLHEMSIVPGSKKKRNRVGRGIGSGNGKTAGKGMKGQLSRSGGQMPLYRRLARRGFSNYPFKEEYEVVSLDAVSVNFEDGEVVSLESLKDKGLVKGADALAKVLANGELTKKVVFEGLKISASAVEKIKAAGGEIR